MPKSKPDEATLDFATISELNSYLREKQISARDLASHFLKRLETYGPEYNALAAILEKSAKKDAQEVDGDLKRERYRGMLQGIPYGAKDLISARGAPTTWGAKPFADQTFDDDAHVVHRLRKTGAVLIGKLSMVELAGGGSYNTASASLQGPGLNPWNKAYWSGGSSSGSGIAVAAGLVPYALGSETSGSIITPAAYCGVTGLRPTYGLVSRRGAMPLSWTCDKLGVLARSANDCGYVLHEMAGGDSDDPSSAGKSFYYTPQYSRALRDMRIGYNPIDFEEWPEESMRPAYRTALNVVKTLGAEPVVTKLPDFPYGLVIGTVIDCEAASVFETFIRSGKVDQLADPTQVNGLKASLDYSALDYLKAMRVRSQIQQAFRELFAGIDVLVAPSKFNLPERVDQPFDQQERAQPPKPVNKGVGAGLIQASNLCGLPGLSVPCGLVNGLPIGLQFVGPAFSENTLLALGRTFQSLTDFHKRHPSLTKPS
ncbi:MAG TPA: amidase [Bryobacteraceae bacterium]|nr:amidase [Bryobacteraceae bacterium]